MVGVTEGREIQAGAGEERGSVMARMATAGVAGNPVP